MLEIRQVPILNDNYAYLLHEPQSGAAAVVDPGEAEPVLAAAAEAGWEIGQILLTHHHADHIGGAAAIKAATGARIVAPAADAGRIPDIDEAVVDGDAVAVGEARAAVFEVPGHTLGHVAYWFMADDALFSGDTLFALGCGRLFEGSPEQMWESLSRLRALPDETWVYCAHEYTASNARFAATIDADNPDLAARIDEIMALCRSHTPTVPSRLGVEKETNPFLRADDPAIAHAAGLDHADPVTVFAEVRRRKDVF